MLAAADSAMQGIYSADTCKIIRSLVSFVCVLLYLLNQLQMGCSLAAGTDMPVLGVLPLKPITP